MTIASEITRINNNISAAYTVCNNKGATMPVTQNSANLATCIDTISSSAAVIQSLNVTPSTSSQTITVPSGVDGYSPITVSAVTSSIDQNIIASNIKKDITILNVTGTYEGIIPSGTISITQNGTYDVTNYANASVSVSGGYSEFPSYQVSNGVVNHRSGILTGNEFSGITSISAYGLYYTFYRCDNLIGTLNLSSLTSIGDYGLSYTFYGCSGLTSVNLSSLTTVGSDGMEYAFRGCTELTNVDLSSLTTISNSGLAHAFQNCTNLASIDLSALEETSTSALIYAFQNCTSLTSINFSSLTKIDTQALLFGFYSCSSLTTVDFPVLTNLIGSSQLNNCFSYCTSITDIYFRALTTTSFGNINVFVRLMERTGTTVTHTLHFPSNLESTISALIDYPLFGGSSGYVTLAFDLPATS